MPFDIRPAPKTLELLMERAGVGQKTTSQGGRGGPKPGSNDNFWGNVNRAALDDIGRWWRDLFPKGYPTGKSWRAGLVGRGLQEDIAATRDGIVDWGVHDFGDGKKGRRSPIELVVEYGSAADHAEAARWLCDRLGITPESLGWIDWAESQNEGIDPTYPSGELPLEHVRSEVEATFARFFAACEQHHACGDDDAVPPAWAMRVTTAVGKTRIAARTIANDIKRRKEVGEKARPFVYAVPTHRLGEEIEQEFIKHGIIARVFRGRFADDPSRPGSSMCDDRQAVDIALGLGETVQSTVCEGEGPDGQRAVCPFFQTCSYQTQKADPPQVWIIAHTLLFQAQAAIGKPGMVVIDEGFWSNGLWASKRGITLDEIETVRDAPGSSPFAAAYLRPHRIKLARALRRQTEQGGLLRGHLIDEGLTAEICGEAITLEWRLKTSTAIWPAMPADARRRAAEAVRGAKHVRAIVNVWDAVRGLLDHDDRQAVSGRLWFKDQETDHGIVRTVMTRGVKRISRQWSAPTILLDATLPERSDP